MALDFDVIIIGGSYSGLSAAMALGRASRKVLVIDSGKPCNQQTPHSHNFITHDGETPAKISEKAKEQVLNYPTIRFLNGKAITGKKNELFQINTETGDSYYSKKLLFASGLKDIMPAIPGFSECWGISILHCPYCHGYEIKNEKTGLIGNGDLGFEFVKMISHWTNDLTLLTNGVSTLTKEQREKIEGHNIKIVETEIDRIEHSLGYIKEVILKDGSKISLRAIYAKPAFSQHCTIPSELGCELTEQGLIKVDAFQKTNIYGIYAAGDNTVSGRAVSFSVASGTMAGVFMNKELIEEDF